MPDDLIMCESVWPGQGPSIRHAWAAIAKARRRHRKAMAVAWPQWYSTRVAMAMPHWAQFIGATFEIHDTPIHGAALSQTMAQGNAKGAWRTQTEGMATGMAQPYTHCSHCKVMGNTRFTYNFGIGAAQPW